MKSAFRASTLLLVSAFAVLSISCQSDNTVKRKKAVPPSEDISGLPLNRPRSFENSAGMGRMIQTR